MTPSDLTVALGRHRTTAIVRARDTRAAAAAMDAAIAGGFRFAEFTLTTPGAYELITDLARRGPQPGGDMVMVGAGTVLEVAEVERVARCGGTFIVSPIFDPEIVRAAAAHGLAAIPGTHTPTEMVMAQRAGAPLVKLFPAPAGGPTWLASVLAPLPQLRIIPTNGVTLDNVTAWLAAGAWAVGLVADLFRPEWIAANDWPAITAHAKAIRDAVESIGAHPAAGAA